MLANAVMGREVNGKSGGDMSSEIMCAITYLAGHYVGRLTASPFNRIASILSGAPAGRGMMSVCRHQSSSGAARGIENLARRRRNQAYQGQKAYRRHGITRSFYQGDK